MTTSLLQLHFCTVALICATTSLEAQRRRPGTQVPPPVIGPVRPATPETKPGVPTAAAVATVLQVAKSEHCNAADVTWWSRHKHYLAADTIRTGGAIACSPDPTRPAILLFHGLHQNKSTWTAPSYTEYAWDYQGSPPSEKRIEGTQSEPRVGPHHVGRSEWLYGDNRAGWDADVNWFDYLRKQNFTVATWTQVPETFDAAYPSAVEAFDTFLAHTLARSPNAPPPVALVAHSRGGLLIRKLLKEKGSQGRVRWVVTIHTPHGGSEHGRLPGQLTAEVVDLWESWIPGEMPARIKEEAKEVIMEGLRPLTKMIWKDENRELQSDGPLIRGLAEGEAELPDVKYYTWGGLNPNVFRMYLWNYDAMSIVPQTRCCPPEAYYVWRIKPVEIGPLSPVAGALRDFIPELKPGYGDILVAEEKTRLPWSTHFTDQLNHAEVLWNRDLQRQVAELIK
jgi:hypothetical protein